jgi:hypothetical protein
MVYPVHAAVRPIRDRQPAGREQTLPVPVTVRVDPMLPFASSMVVVWAMNMTSSTSSGQEWSIFWDRLLLWSLLLSLSMNSGLAYLALDNSTPARQAGGIGGLTLELVPELPSWVHEVRKQVAAPASSQPTALTFVTGKAARPMFDKVRVSITDPALNTTLRQIKADIGKLWESADPPSWGRVLVAMEIAPDGTILHMGIDRLSGPQGLERFVFELVKAAGPFTSAMDGRTEPVWVECDFSVEALQGEA